MLKRGLVDARHSANAAVWFCTYLVTAGGFVRNLLLLA